MTKNQKNLAKQKAYKTLPFINTRIHAKIQTKYQDKGHTTF